MESPRRILLDCKASKQVSNNSIIIFITVYVRLNKSAYAL